MMDIIVKKLWIGGLLSKQISMRISKCMASTATFVSNTKFAMPWMVSIHQAADRGIWANVPPPPPKKRTNIKGGVRVGYPARGR